MFIGVLYILAACFGWGVVFIIPDLIKGFSPWEIACGRFLCFGLISVCWLLTKKRILLQKKWWPIWRKAFWLGCLSTIVCYTAAVFCVQHASPKMATLLFGMVPIAVALCGNFQKKEYPFAVILVPCALLLVGVLLSNIEAFALPKESLPSYLGGLALGFFSIFTWVWYVLSCFDFMKKQDTVDSSDWVLMIGSSAFCFSILALVFVIFVEGYEKYTTMNFLPWIGGSLVLGGISSWLSLYFWTQGNLRLPITLVGQLSIFELIFGMLFLFIVQHRLPNLYEISGIFLMIIGLIQALTSIEKKKRAPS